MQRIIAGVLAILLAACAASGNGRDRVGRCLQIRQFPTASFVAQVPLPEDGVFSLSFIHSVSRTPVRDDYRCDGERIVQTAESFRAHGAGLPSGADEPGVSAWEQHDGWFVIRMRREIPRLVVRTDRNYRNRLHVQGKEIDLNRWPDQALELVVVTCAVP